MRGWPRTACRLRENKGSPLTTHLKRANTLEPSGAVPHAVAVRTEGRAKSGPYPPGREKRRGAEGCGKPERPCRPTGTRFRHAGYDLIFLSYSRFEGPPATLTPSGDQNAVVARRLVDSGASCVPLPEQLQGGGFDLGRVARKGRVAIYEQTKAGPACTHPLFILAGGQRLLEKHPLRYKRKGKED